MYEALLLFLTPLLPCSNLPPTLPQTTPIATPLESPSEWHVSTCTQVCFICGLNRFVLDTKGDGFDHHIEHEHNMWHYLYLAVHLKIKAKAG